MPDRQTGRGIGFLNPKQYGELRDISLKVAQTFHPRDAYPVGVGQNAAPTSTFLELLGRDVAASLPVDDLLAPWGGGAKRGRAAQAKALGATFAAFLSPAALRSGRDVVLFQKAGADAVLVALKPALQAWLAKHGYRNAVKIVALTAAGQEPSSGAFDGTLQFSGATFDAIGTSAFELISPYARVAAGDEAAEGVARPYDERGNQAPRTPRFETFRNALDRRMSGDAVLVDLTW